MPVVAPAEHVLDLVMLAILRCIVRHPALRLGFDEMQTAMPRLAKAAQTSPLRSRTKAARVPGTVRLR